VAVPTIRERVLSHLVHVDAELARRVATGLGMDDVPRAATTTVPARDDVKPSPALGLLGKAKETLEGRVVAALVGDGVDGARLAALRAAVEAAGAKLQLVARTITGVKQRDGARVQVDHAMPGGASVLFDAVAILPGKAGLAALRRESAALDFVRDAYAHLKVIAFDGDGEELLRAAGLTAAEGDAGLVRLSRQTDAARFVATAKKGRVWAREPATKNPT